MSTAEPFEQTEAPSRLLTVCEAARLLQISRSMAYQLARDYEHSGGTVGLPVIRFGAACLRVPRWALLELATTGRVVRLCDAELRQTGAPVVR